MTTKSLASSGKKFCLHLQCNNENFTLYLCGFILVYFNVGNTRIHIYLLNYWFFPSSIYIF